MNVSKTNYFNISLLVLTSFCLTYFNYSNWLYFTNTNPSSPSSIILFTLDGINYFNGAISMIQDNAIFFTKDIYHSPGGQIWLSWIFRLFDSYDPLLIKKINFLVHLTIQILMFFFTKKFLGWRVGLISVISVAASSFYQIYIATLQYEVVLSLTVFLIIYLLSKKKLLKTLYTPVVLAILCFFMFMIRYHYVCVAILTLTMIFKAKRTIWIFLICYLLLTSLFILSYKANGINYHEVSQNSARQLRWLSPLSEGFNYPYPQTSPSITPGWHYIWEHPFSYLNQLSKRFSYLFGLKKDSYYLPSILTRIIQYLFKVDSHFYSSILELLLIVAGFAICALKFKPIAIAYLGISFCFYAPLLIVGATQRFIIPLLPIHIFFIILSIKEFMAVIKCFLNQRFFKADI